jgi:hypothetical protein
VNLQHYLPKSIKDSEPVRVLAGILFDLQNIVAIYNVTISIHPHNNSPIVTSYIQKHGNPVIAEAN